MNFKTHFIKTIFCIIFLCFLACSSNDETTLDPVLPEEPEKPLPEVEDITSVIKDVELKKYILNAIKEDWAVYDTEEPIGVLSSSEIAKVRRLDLNAYDNDDKVTSLEGLEYFTGLEYLDCSWNKITKLDLTNNHKLAYLNCSYNLLAKLELSTNTKLTTLICNDNLLEKLDVSKLEELKTLNFSKNALDSINLIKNPVLYSLNCSENNIKELNIEANVQLTDLNCSNNKIQSLDISQNSKLADTFSKIDLTDNPLNLLYVWKNYKQSDRYKMPSGVRISERFYLSYIDDITTIIKDKNFKEYVKNAIANEWAQYDTDMPKGILSSDEISKIIKIDVANKEIYSLDAIEYFVGLQELNVQKNKLSKLMLSNNVNLVNLDCSNNLLTTIDIDKNTKLKTLDVSNNKLVALYLKNIQDINEIICNNNTIQSLDITHCKNLEKLVCSYNNMLALDLKDLSNLKYASVGYNPMLSLVMQGCNNVEELYCDRSYITTLDVSDWGNLKILSWTSSSNRNAFLILKSNFKLEKLKCTNLQITELDLKEIPNIKILNFENTKISRLELKSMEKLEELSFSGNAYSYRPNITIDNCQNLRTLSLDVDTVKFINAPHAAFYFNNIKGNLLHFYKCDKLEFVNAGSTTGLIVEDCPNFEGTTKSYRSVSIINCPKITEQPFSSNNITEEVAIEKCSGLKNLSVSDYPYLKKITVTDCINLTSVSVNSNPKLTSLTINNTTSIDKITTIDCKYNPSLKDFDALSLSAVSKIDFSGSYINLSKIGGKGTVKEIYCVGSGLSSINLTGYDNLEILDCSKNKISRLVFDQAPKLRILNVNSQVDTYAYLSVYHNSELEEFYCDTKQDGSLSVRSKKLKKLYYPSYAHYIYLSKAVEGKVSLQVHKNSNIVYKN